MPNSRPTATPSSNAGGSVHPGCDDDAHNDDGDDDAANVRHPGTRPGRRPRSGCRRRQMSPARPRARSPRPSRETAASAGPPGAEGRANRSDVTINGWTRSSEPNPRATACMTYPAVSPSVPAHHSGRFIKTRRKRDPWSRPRSPTTQPAAAQPIRSRTGMRSRERTGSRARSPPHRARGADVMSGSKADRPAAPHRSPRTRRANWPPIRSLRGHSADSKTVRFAGAVPRHG